jgi:hypothetical protein
MEYREYLKTDHWKQVRKKKTKDADQSWFGPFGDSAAPAPQVPPREVVPANEVNPPLKFQ